MTDSSENYEFTPQSVRVSLCAKLVYDPDTQRLGSTRWDAAKGDWEEPKFRNPPQEGFQRMVADADVVLSYNDTFDAEYAVRRLLDESRVFVNYRRYLDLDGTASDQPTMVVFANCSDVFAWGTADAEPIESEAALKRLMAHLRRDPDYGDLVWACQARNEQPQGPWADKLKEEGKWTALLEGLPANHYDRWLQEYLAQHL